MWRGGCSWDSKVKKKAVRSGKVVLNERDRVYWWIAGP